MSDNNKDRCLYYRAYIDECVMRYACAFKNEDNTCKLSGNIKTCLVYVPKHIRKDIGFVFRRKYTLDEL